MESTNGLITIPPDTGAPVRPGSTQGSSGGLGGRPALAVAGVVIAAGIGLALSQHWLDLATLVPLLFVLPCMAMMFMCIKGMNRSQQTDSTTKRRSTDDGPLTGAEPRTSAPLS